MSSEKYCFTLCFVAFFTLVQAQNLAFPQTARPLTCSTPNNRPGLCIIIERCQSLLALLQSPPLSTRVIQFMRQSQCGGFQGRSPIVCCANDETNFPDSRNPFNLSPPVNPITTPETTRAPRESTILPDTNERIESGTGNTNIVDSDSLDNHRNLPLLPKQDCGVDFTGRIFGGTATDLGEFPWAAMLRYRGRDGREHLLCGGVVINQRYVLTAAHCSNSGDLSGYRLTGVRLGEHDTSSPIDCEPVHNGEPICAPAPLNFDIEEEIAHPDYVKGNKSQPNDIALLRLNANIDFSTDYIKPICLPTERDVRLKNYVGDSLTAAGWGRTQFGVNSAIKLRVDVPVVTNDDCSTFYKTKNIQISARQMCAGGVDGQDTCRGDSGGALMSVERIQQQLRYYVTGIVSIGPEPCGQLGQPGVYTRVTDYSNWILNQMRP